MVFICTVNYLKFQMGQKNKFLRHHIFQELWTTVCDICGQVASHSSVNPFSPIDLKNTYANIVDRDETGRYQNPHCLPFCPSFVIDIPIFNS